MHMANAAIAGTATIITTCIWRMLYTPIASLTCYVQKLSCLIFHCHVDLVTTVNVHAYILHTHVAKQTRRLITIIEKQT